MIGEGMFDAQVIDTGSRSVAMVNEEMYEGDSLSVDKFYREEMIQVFASEKTCTLKIIDRSRPKLPILEVETNFLALTPNFFGKGYSVFCAHGFVMDLDLESWKYITGGKLRVLYH